MNEKSYKVSVLTLGCRVNQYESDSISAELQKNGVEIVPFGEKCDLSLVNTCTVTAESDRKSRQMIRRASQNADKVAVIGCYSEINSKEASGIDGVIYVSGNREKGKIAENLLKILSGNENTPPCLTPYNTVEMTLTTPMRTRSYIKIEDGCENKCAYCIINKARGEVRSKSPELVLSEARTLAEKGAQEIILTGIETASYGIDFEKKKPYGHYLAELVREIDKIDGIERIGLGSLDPTVFSEYFVSVISECKKLLPHFHISLQSGSSNVLARMRRKYNSEMAIAAIDRVKNTLPSATFSADIIVGFPGESEEDFLETVRFCEKVRFLHLHIFPYSKRAGTEAAEMRNQIDGRIKSLRASKLSEIGEKIKTEICESYVTAHASVPVKLLVEKNFGKTSTGHSEHFVEVKAHSCPAKVGEIVEVTLESYDGKFVIGKKR